jgi:hypothetical protein
LRSSPSTGRLFTKTALVVLIDGAYQNPQIPLAPSLGIIEFLTNEEGTQIRIVEKSALDSFRPGWPTDPPGPVRNVMRPDAGDKFAFFCYPPAVADGEITVRHVALPVYGLASPSIDDRLVPFLPALAAYVAARAEAREVEEAGPQRKASFEADFLAAAGASK